MSAAGVVSREPERLVLDVGGIGFELLTTRSAERLATPGEMCTVETVLLQDYEAYRFRRTDPAVALAFEALEACGYEPRPIQNGSEVTAATSGSSRSARRARRTARIWRRRTTCPTETRW